jgi:putative phage-type endonuclease
VSLGSSDVPKVLGLSPWGSPWEVWSRLHGLTGYDSGGSPATSRGHMLEGALLARYASETGLQVVPGPPLGMPGIVHPRLPWAHARPDGFASDGQTAWLVEVKTARYLDEEDGWGDAGTDRIPVYYLAQVAWQMACTGADRVDVVAFGVGRDDYRVFVVRRDPVLIDSLERKVARWHRRHVEGGELPAVDGSDEARVALALRWPRHQGEALDLVADDETARLAHELASVRDALDHLEGRRTLLEQTLQARMGAARRLVDAHGMRLATWGDSRPRTSVDLDALRAALPEVAARFTKQGRPVRPFRLHRKAEDQAA